MTGIQIYNLVWLTIWAMMFIASIVGIIAGNWVYWCFAAFSLYFCGLLFTDNEDGESLKQLVTRKIKAHKKG